jgi:hypothetical protein
MIFCREAKRLWKSTSSTEDANQKVSWLDVFIWCLIFIFGIEVIVVGGLHNLPDD